MVLTFGFQNILNPSSMLASDGDTTRCQANLCESFSARRGRGHEYMTHQLMTFKARKQGTPWSKSAHFLISMKMIFIGA